MREEKKKERAAAKLAELFGMAAPEKPKPIDILASQDKSRTAEAAISYLEEPKRFVTRNCKICDSRFAVDRFNISCCSDTCRAKNLLSYGVVWEPNRPVTERWAFNTGGPEPLIVPSEVLPMLIAIHQESEEEPQPDQPADQSIDDLLASLDL